MQILAVHGITKTYGKHTAVDHLDLEIQSGEIFGLIGPDGAGKTTTMRLLLGILKADSGSGHVGDFDLISQPDRISTLTGYVSQRFSLYGELTVQENLELFADLYRVDENELAPRLQRLMQFSRLEPFRDRLAQNLSGGMKQKLALSCALIHTPKVLFLDEPTTGVDPLSRRDLWRLLFDLWQEGVTIVVSTPYMDEAERCSRIGFLDRGKLLAVGRPDDLRAGFRGMILEVIAAQRFTAKGTLSEIPQVRDVNLFGEGLHVTFDSMDAVAAEQMIRAKFVASGQTIQSIRPVKPSIEDVFFQITAGGAA